MEQSEVIQTTTNKQERRLHLIFVVSILVKLFDAIVETLAGIFLLFTGATTKLIDVLIHQELIEDPHDVVANFIQQSIPYFDTHAQLFAAAYLLSHGVVKVLISINILRGRLWAYPAALIVFTLFIVYQVYEYMHTHSFFLVLLTVFDLFIIWLTWHEYKQVQKHLADKI